MTVKSSTVVYLTPSSRKEGESLQTLLEPYSWAIGEFGLILTDVAFAEAVDALSAQPEYGIREALTTALTQVRKASAGDVCLNFGFVE